MSFNDIHSVYFYISPLFFYLYLLLICEIFWQSFYLLLLYLTTFLLPWSVYLSVRFYDIHSIYFFISPLFLGLDLFTNLCDFWLQVLNGPPSIHSFSTDLLGFFNITLKQKKVMANVKHIKLPWIQLHLLLLPPLTSSHSKWVTSFYPVSLFSH